MLQDLGKVPSNIERVDPSKGYRWPKTPNFEWPMAITGGDISRDGSRILVRNYQGKHNGY